MRTAVLSSLAGREAKTVSFLLAQEKFVEKESLVDSIAALAEIVGARGEMKDADELLISLESAPSIAVKTVVALGKGLKRAKKQLERENRLVVKLFNQAAQVVGDAEAELDARLDYVELLGFQSLDQAQPLLLGLLDAREPQALQIAAIETLGRFSEKQIATLLLEAYHIADSFCSRGNYQCVACEKQPDCPTT